MVNEHLPLPNPGIDEYRKYWNEHEVKQTDYSNMGEEGAKPKTITVLTASFVSAQADHVPTDKDWTECLKEAGYTEDKIKEILGNA